MRGPFILNLYNQLCFEGWWNPHVFAKSCYVRTHVPRTCCAIAKASDRGICSFPNLGAMRSGHRNITKLIAKETACRSAFFVAMLISSLDLVQIDSTSSGSSSVPRMRSASDVGKLIAQTHDLVSESSLKHIMHRIRTQTMCCSVCGLQKEDALFTS